MALITKRFEAKIYCFCKLTEIIKYFEFEKSIEEIDDKIKKLNYNEIKESKAIDEYQKKKLIPTYHALVKTF